MHVRKESEQEMSDTPRTIIRYKIMPKYPSGCELAEDNRGGLVFYTDWLELERELAAAVAERDHHEKAWKYQAALAIKIDAEKQQMRKALEEIMVQSDPVHLANHDEIQLEEHLERMNIIADKALAKSFKNLADDIERDFSTAAKEEQ